MKQAKVYEDSFNLLTVSTARLKDVSKYLFYYFYFSLWLSPLSASLVRHEAVEAAQDLHLLEEYAEALDVVETLFELALRLISGRVARFKLLVVVCLP